MFRYLGTLSCSDYQLARDVIFHRSDSQRPFIRSQVRLLRRTSWKGLFKEGALSTSLCTYIGLPNHRSSSLLLINFRFFRYLNPSATANSSLADRYPELWSSASNQYTHDASISQHICTCHLTYNACYLAKYATPSYKVRASMFERDAHGKRAEGG
jgi:hypothetical protein